MTVLTVEIDGLSPGDWLLAPVGMATPHDTVTGFHVERGRVAAVLPEAELGLCAALIEAEGGGLSLRYQAVRSAAGCRYPEAAFAGRANRFTQAATDLVEASRAVAARAGGGNAGIAALVAEAECRFAYAHPERRFNDGHDAVPYLSCGATPGSCVDINTYLVASLRAAGYEAAYLYGYFFPAERGGITNDMHCWVATRHGGEIREWDIAHHMKAGLGPTHPGLNPRPGSRIALGHSMGHRYRASDVPALLKLLAEPVALARGEEPRAVPVAVRCDPAPSIDSAGKAGP